MCHVDRSLVIAADPETVWSIAADLGRETDFWKGSKAVRTLATQGNAIEREVTLAFRNRLQRERVTLEPPSRILHELHDGPMHGTKVVTLMPAGPGRTEIRAVYDIRLRGLLKLGSRMVAKHVGEGTQHALERIRDVAEGRTPSV